MTISLMSKPVAIVDTPGEIEDLKVDFKYNFFSPDESINENFSNTPLISTILDGNSNVTLQNIIRERKYERYIPRYINLSWTPYTSGLGERPDLIDKISIARNLNKVLSEEKISGKHFTSVIFKDNGVDGKIDFSIKRAMEEVLKSQGIKDVTTLQNSPLDLVKILNRYTGQEIKGNFLAESFINLRKLGIEFLDQTSLNVTAKKLSNRLLQLKIKSAMNNMFIETTLNSATQETDNIFGDETYALLPVAKNIQESTIAERPSYNVSYDDYVIDVLGDYIEIEDNSNLFPFEFQLIGYIITKTEYPSNRQPIIKAPIVIESPTIGNYTDLNVKYGSKYGYSIRSVFMVKLPAIDEDTKRPIAATFLISSEDSAEQYVECIETRPPNPPTDFTITWDYKANNPRLTWSFPVDSQRDVKYFQVFKRKSIEEPFELIKMYAFNDSMTPLAVNQLPEFNVDQRVVEELRNSDGTATPKSLFLDKDFTKESTAIYTVAAIDAHGLTSNYTLQIEVSFDKFKNKIITKLISVAGAPKAYPNFFLQRDTFVDSIRTNGSTKLSIYFNPEYLKVFDREGNDLRLIKTDGDATYKLQMINVDLQKDGIIDIKVNNTIIDTNNILPTNVNNVNPVGGIRF